MDFKWTRKQNNNTKFVQQISTELGISEALSSLLTQRDITTFDQAKTFFNPKLEDLHDPFLMKDMENAVVRIEEAISNKENILVYGDYDVDGTTSVAMMYSFLKTQTPHLEYYIPDRYSEGYGISKKSIDYANQQGIKLIIALDCGIRSIDLVNYAKNLGIDYIICDHHLPGEEVPSAKAVLDPKQNNCEYPFKELSGCGVGFKLIAAFCIKNDIPEDVYLEYLDLLVVSTACDIVPITGENRVLAFYGTQKLNKRPRAGLKALAQTHRNYGKFTVSDIVFGIGPKINAAGRMKDGNYAVRLLVEKDENTALTYAKELNEINENRQEVDQDITEEALGAINEIEDYKSKSTTVVGKTGWSKGVIGIVASRLIEKHYKPTIVFSEKDGFMTGSARSVKGFNVYEPIEACSHLIEQFGGHKYAAGLTIKTENFDLFKDTFEEEVKKRIKNTQLTPSIEYDAELAFEEISENMMNILKRMRPFGPENMSPIFVSRNVLNAGSRLVKEVHLKCAVMQNNKAISGIAFNMGKKLELLESGPVDICYALEWNEFRGNRTIQLMVKDIKPSSGTR